MSNKKIEVTVTGGVLSCKDKIAYMIKKELEKYHYKVNFTPPIDYRNLSYFEYEVAQRLPLNTDDTEIILTVNQANRSF